MAKSKTTKTNAPVEPEVFQTNAVGATAETGKQKGRKVNPNSKRQARLAEMAAKKADPNYVPKRGRPIVPDSKHAIAKAEREAAIAAGTFVPGHRGRPIEADSKRQQKIQTIQMAKEAGTYRLGRPTNPNSKLLLS